MNIWNVLGAIAAGVLISAADPYIFMYKLTKAELKKELLKSKLNKLVVKNVEKGEENYKVKVWLYNEEDNEKEELVFEAVKIGFGKAQGARVLIRG